MDTLIADLKHALRMLRRSPGFTLTAVSALALGIGANTAIFSVVDAVLLKPLPYPEPGRVVQLMIRSPQGSGAAASVPIYNTWRAQDRVLADVTAYDMGGPGLNLSGGDHPEQVRGVRVSREYFQLFGVPMMKGRPFTAEEDLPRGPRVAVIGFGLWQRRYGGNPGMVGNSIQLGGEPYTVVGIIGPDFAPDPPADIWLPFQADPNSTNGAFYFRAAARLKPGVTLDQAKVALDLAAVEHKRKFPNALGPKGSFTAEPMAETIVKNIRPTLYILLWAVGFVLLIACANVANLLLARAGGRAREMAIRAAIGAARARIVRQLLTESVVLAFVGGVVGLLVGAAGVRALLAINPGNIPRIGQDGAAITLDWRVLAFTALLSLITGVVFGLVPALHASRADLNATLKESGVRSGGGRQNFVRSALVVVEMVLAIVLLAGAGLLIRTFMALHSVEPGFNAHNVLTFTTSLTGSRFDRTSAIDNMARSAEERIEAVPGVEAAAATTSLPLQNALGLPFTIEGRPLIDGDSHGGAEWSYITHRYFDVFHIRLVSGRFFDVRDNGASPGVAVINEAMAKKYWPNANPVGQRISIAKGLKVFDEPPREIVGIAADVHDDGLNADPFPKMYVPLGQVKDAVMAMNNRFMPLSWGVRTSGDPYLLSAAIQRELQTSADLPAAEVRSMDQVVVRTTSRTRFDTLLLAIFAGTAILLACIGLYGLMSYSVQQRTLEFGIRLALGAESSSLRNMVMRYAMLLAAIGIVLGLGGAFWLTRFMSGLLFGVKPFDPIVFSSVAILLAFVAMLASFLPAQRAVRIDPMVALRYE
jgi:putative ABC transport system permease protein